MLSSKSDERRNLKDSLVQRVLAPPFQNGVGHILKNIAAETIVKDFAMDENSKQSVCQFVRDKMPKPWELFCFPGLLSVTGEIALLREVCEFYDCFAMSPAVLESLSEVPVSTKHCENVARIASSLYAFTIEDLNNLVAVYEEEMKMKSPLIALTS